MLFSGPMTVSLQRGTCHMCTDCGGPEIKSKDVLAFNLSLIHVCGFNA